MTTALAIAASSSGNFLIFNAGSSSLKFALFGGEAAPVCVLSGGIDRIGLPESTFTLRKTGSQQTESAGISAPNHVSCLDYLLKRLAESTGAGGICAIGHRVVHGGPRYAEPQVVDLEMIDELRRICPFAPEHLPAEIGLITALAERFPHVPQVACFDTAFHRDLPRVARLLPIPRRYEAAGVRRYGFHGLSYEFLMQELARLASPETANGRIILAHLGNGASLAAVRQAVVLCAEQSKALLIR